MYFKVTNSVFLCIVCSILLTETLISGEFSVQRVEDCWQRKVGEAATSNDKKTKKSKKAKKSARSLILYFGDGGAEVLNILEPSDSKNLDAVAKCVQQEDSHLFDLSDQYNFGGSNVTYLTGTLQRVLPELTNAIRIAVQNALDRTAWDEEREEEDVEENENDEDEEDLSMSKYRRHTKQPKQQHPLPQYGIRAVQYLSFKKEGLEKYRRVTIERVDAKKRAESSQFIVYPDEESMQRERLKHERGDGKLDPESDEALIDYLHDPFLENDTTGSEEQKKKDSIEHSRDSSSSSSSSSSISSSSSGNSGGYTSNSLNGTVYTAMILLSERSKFTGANVLSLKRRGSKKLVKARGARRRKKGSSASAADIKLRRNTGGNADSHSEHGLDSGTEGSEDKDNEMQEEEEEEEELVEKEGGGEYDGSGVWHEKYSSMESQISRFTPEMGSVLLLHGGHATGTRPVLFGDRQMLVVEFWKYADATVGSRRGALSEARPLPPPADQQNEEQREQSVRSDL